MRFSRLVAAALLGLALVATAFAGTPLRPGCGERALRFVFEGDAEAALARVAGPPGTVDVVWYEGGLTRARSVNEDQREAFGFERNRPRARQRARFLVFLTGLAADRRLQVEATQTGGETSLRVEDALSGAVLAEWRLASEVRRYSVDACRARPLEPPPARGPAPRAVAFYYPWWGTRAPDCGGDDFGWFAGTGVFVTAHTPVPGDAARTAYRALGCWRRVTDRTGRKGWIYDVSDPAFLEEQMRLARASGVDAFAVSVHGDNPEEMAFLRTRALPVAERAGFAVAALLEAPERGWTRDDRADEARIAAHLAAVVEALVQSPAALRIEGRPVVFLDPLVLLRFADGAVWKRVRAAAKPHFLWSGPGGLVQVFSGAFDGVYHDLDVVETLEAPLGLEPYALRDERRLHYWATAAWARRSGLALALPAVPGWEGAEVRRAPGDVQLPRDYGRPGKQGAYYRVRWEDLLEARPDWAVLTSWNEWAEGTELEPSDRYPPARFDFLEATRRYVERFKRTARR